MKLNPEQQRAVDSNSKAIMVLAVPGSGKTETLKERERRLLDSGVSAYEILVITFTRKAAQMLKERLAAFMPEEDLRKMYIGTSHSFCCRIIRDFGELIGYGKNFVIYDEIDRKDVLEAIIEDYKYKVNIKKMLRKISVDAKDDFEGDEAKVWSEYCARLKRFNALDYDLILEMAVKLLREFPQVREHYRNRFKYIFYDEFHDLASLEDQMLLTLDIENSFVVCDYSQAIYAFRGTSNKYILAYQNRHPDCEIIKLPVNYRSVPEICKAAERLINHNSQPFGKYVITPARETPPLPHGGGIKVSRGLTDEADYIALKLRDVNIRPGDCAILVRTNDQISPIRDALKNAGLPVQVVRRDFFWEREEIKNVLAFLRLAENQHDDFSMRRVLRLPYLGTSPLAMRKLHLKAMSDEITLYDAYGGIPEVRAMARHTNFAQSAFGRFLETSSYLAWLEKQRLVTKIESILSLGEKIQEFVDASEDYDFSLRAFLESISLESAIDKWDEKEDAISLMTIHCAKGLEWPCVWIAGCEDGLIPLRSGDLEEERRLFFVGITRARDQLYISGSRERYRFGKVSDCNPSPFITEMGI